MDVEPSEGVQLEQTIEAQRLRAPGDRAVMTVGAFVVIAALFGGAALIVFSTHLAGHADDPEIVLGLALVAATAALVSLILGLDLSRRRRLVAALDRLGARIASEHRATDEALGGLAREIEQIGEKVSGEMWKAYAAGVEDGRASLASVRPVRPAN